MKNLRVATAQFESRSGDKEYNLGIIAGLAAKAAEAGADVIATHECSITGYSHARRLSREGLWELAEPVPDGPSVQRLIEIARALAANPTLLLLDEPAAGLNSTEKLELHELLKRIAAQGLTILIIDHDMTLVSEAAQHITVLNFGRRIADGESMMVLRHPDVVSAYLGNE